MATNRGATDGLALIGNHAPFHLSGYDTELQRHSEILRQACDVQARDNVLDIGCGTGQTTRQAARTSRAGSALGLDVSAPAITRARELAQAEGLTNVTFSQADAQVHRLPPEQFDLAFSRFGTMFFDDPIAAFANIGPALRPGGHLVMMVWQAPELNEWDGAIRQALEGAAPSVTEVASGSDAFSLADPSAVKEILAEAGFAGVTFTDVDEPVYYGVDVAAALDWVRRFRYTTEVLDRVDSAAATAAIERLRETLAAHLHDDGVWLNSRAWLVSALRRHGAV
jgi:ubiquinone/menaquinone biosynthesis C-methylase UbiE